MAPRKAVKHSDAEVVDKAAEAGDVSSLKKRKIVAKTANKPDEEKQIRFPRAAKLAKVGQTENTEATSTITKNVKTRKGSAASKNVTEITKTITKVKAATKKIEENETKTDINSTNVENIEETETKKTRTKAATKKAGTDAVEEAKEKPKGRSKKPAADESAEALEAPVAKKKETANAQAAIKENKSRVKTTRKKADMETKSSSNKNKTTTNIKSKSDVKPEDLTTNTRATKATKATARKTRGRKNEVSTEDEKESKVAAGDLPPLETASTSDNENQESLGNEAEATELNQTTKKGRAMIKKDLAIPPKKVTKPRGKAANRNPDAIKDDNELSKTGKDIQKMKKENTIPTRKGRGKKGTATATVTENGDKDPEDLSEDTLNSLEITSSNNNIQKSSGEEAIEDKVLTVTAESNDSTAISITMEQQN